MTGGYRKIKLFSLMVALVALGLAVVGGTWASQVNYNAGQEAKTYDLNVVYRYQEANGEWKVMDADTQNVFANRTWCPGRTEIVYFEVINKEEFPVDINLTLQMETNQFAESKTMTMAWLTSADINTLKTQIAAMQNWKAFCDAAEAQRKEKGNNGAVEMPAQIELLDSTEKENVLSGNNLNIVSGSGKMYIALAIHMDESATRSDAEKTMSVKFKWQANSNEFSTAQPE